MKYSVPTSFTQYNTQYKRVKTVLPEDLRGHPRNPRVPHNPGWDTLVSAITLTKYLRSSEDVDLSAAKYFYKQLTNE